MGTDANLILVPVDLEVASMQALAFAKELAPRLGAEIVAVHVYTLPRFAYPGFTPVMPPTLFQEIAEAARKAMDRIAAKEGVRVILREGDPTTEILAAIDELKPSLVAMGTHGRGGLARLVLGSVAEKIVRKSTVPVLTMHAPDEEAQTKAASPAATRQAAA